ncbi:MULTISPECIES: hypothetical protein [Serratia]|uniref:hypothetical protein n=1 Tax=Serratia TaxID=613 RepID=UPI00117BB5EA|nr:MULTISPECIES: hypothetical protein [Serratia]MBH2662361.1 hypothetical protein [Serratia ureilytica]MBH3006013.1 hypothetical protein [Serratia ureilytica]MBH3107394.1 hypothetical protein [Serratia ureilytica]MBH3122507.1 hypothetical protein [Serratia ureilytica]MBN5281183.1 hypothetical protein [Serratia ureilytica]
MNDKFDLPIVVLTTALVITATYLIWMRLHTKHYGYFVVKKQKSNRCTIHMRATKCPTGDIAAASIFLGFRSLLRQLKSEGYQYVSFETHMVRKSNVEKLQAFLQSEQFACEQVSYRPTLFIHSFSLKVALRLFHHRRVNVHHESAKMLIRLQ